MDDDSKSRIRKRGIKASRAKLEEAQSLAGYRTQASLAEAIANRENLDSVPKDLVSKIFREIPVSHSSIQRVASVLGVEAYTLYKRDEEEKSEKTPEAQIPELIGKTRTPKSLLNIRGILLFILLGVIGVATAIFTTNDLTIKVEDQTNKNHAGKFANKKPILGTFSLVVDTDERSSKLLHLSSLLKKLEKNYTLSDYSQFNATSSKDLTPAILGERPPIHSANSIDMFLKESHDALEHFSEYQAGVELHHSVHFGKKRLLYFFRCVHLPVIRIEHKVIKRSPVFKQNDSNSPTKRLPHITFPDYP